MLENSYDATGIKFGIIISSELPEYSDLINSNDIDLVTQTLEKVISNCEKVRFIDFSQIDGLKVKEVLELTSGFQFKDAFIFTAYNNFKHSAIDLGYGQINGRNYIRKTILFDNCERYKEMTIDKKIEEYIIENYDNSDEDEKRWMRCFLQRYRYGTQEKTNEFIKQKIDRK